MLDDVQLKQCHVTGCGARRGGRLLAFHDFTISQFPGGADIVMAYCPAAQDEDSDRFAKNPIRYGGLAHLAFVNLRPNPVNDEVAARSSTSKTAGALTGPVWCAAAANGPATVSVTVVSVRRMIELRTDIV
jgi:hypothetical protein